MPPTQAEIDTADVNARAWAWPYPGDLPIGSDRHRDAACQMFRDTFNPYKPSVIEWPKLEPDALQRLVSLPIWDIAVTTEDKARARMMAYSQSVDDPIWRHAIGRNGWEEGRHREVLSDLVSSYGIQLAAEQPDVLPTDPEWGYLVTGYSECIDSFFAFGLFELARRSGFFPRGAGRHVRAGDPGGGAAHPAVRQLARLAPQAAGSVAAPALRIPRGRATWIFLARERIGLAQDLDGGGPQPRTTTSP